MSDDYGRADWKPPRPFRTEVVVASDGQKSIVVRAVTQAEWDAVIAERDRLARWKEEALQVLGTWDLVGVALGSPGALGESRAVAALHAVADLLAERDRLIAEGDRMRDAVRDVMQGLPPGDLRTALTEACWWWERRSTDDRHR